MVQRFHPPIFSGN